MSELDKRRVQFLVYGLTARDSEEIAKSYGLSRQNYRHVSMDEYKDPQTWLPRGYRPGLDICVIKTRAGKHDTLDKKLRAWHEQLFDWLPEEKQKLFLDHVANTLDGFLWCNRVWEAWSYGTMTQNDFTPAGDDDRVIYEHAVNMYVMFLEMQR